MVTARAEAEPNAKAVARAGAQPIVEVIERLICEHCTKDFRSRRQLQEHVQSVHLGIWFYCDQCQHKASTERNLKEHVESRQGFGCKSWNH